MTLAMEFVKNVKTSQKTLITIALPKVPQCVPISVLKALSQSILIRHV